MRNPWYLYKFPLSRAKRIFSQTCKDIPCRHTSIIFIPRKAIIFIRKLFQRHPINPVFRLLLLTEISIDIRKMKARLIGDRTLPILRCCHLCHLMNFLAVSRHTILGRRSKQRIQLCKQLPFSAKQLRKSLQIMGDKKCCLPCAAFRILPTPFIRIKILLPISFGILSPHKTSFCVEKICIILCSALIFRRKLTSPQSPGHNADTPIAISSVKRKIYAFLLFITWYIPIPYIGFRPISSEPRLWGILVRMLKHPFQCVLPGLSAANVIDYSRCDHCVDQCGWHTALFSDGQPSGEPAAFPVIIHKAFQHLRKFIPGNLCKQRIYRAAGIPETIVRVARSLMNTSIYRRIMNHLSSQIKFITFVREQKSTPQTGIKGLLLLFVFKFCFYPPKMLLPDFVIFSQDLIKGSSFHFPVDDRFCNFC